MTGLPTEPCSECQGTGQVAVRRYFCKTGWPAHGKVHAAVNPPYGPHGHWWCGCGVSSRCSSAPMRVEWLAELGELEPCAYIRDAIAAGWWRLP